MPNWTSILKSAVPTPCFDRPFVCEGFPSESTVLVIGENPATELGMDWWEFWDRKTGFNYPAFLDCYMERRSSLGNRMGNTRRRLQRFRYNQVKCVESNVHQNERPGGAGGGTSNANIIRLLMQNMPRLRAIVAHGKVAHQFVAHLEVPVDVMVFRMRHFRMESYDAIDDVCEKISDA